MERAVRGLWRELRRDLLSEWERWPLWFPAGLLGGISLYFFLPSEPWPGAGASALILFAVAAFLLRRRRAVAALFVALATLAGGFALAQLETQLVATPVLAGEVGPRPVTGRIVAVEPREADVRIVLGEVFIPGIAPEAAPRRVRLSVRTSGGIQPVPGVEVTVLAILDRPPEPAWPGGFDFARDAYFDGIGGSGFAVGPLTAAKGEVADPSQNPARRLFDAIQTVRLEATGRIFQALPGETGGVAAALLTGHRGGIPDDMLLAIRDSGLQHILSISGLHIGMVATFVFFTIRLLLAAIEPVALRWPIKSWAAATALFATFAYLLISDMAVPAVRSFLMTGVVLCAVMVGREAISLRLVAIAATLVLVVMPHAALGASFQLSFAAVLALVAAWEAMRERLVGWRAGTSWAGHVGIYFAGVLLTTLVAGTATTPFVLALFGRMAVWSPIANMLAVPLFGVWIMPWGMLALVLMPLGLEAWALIPMGWGIDVMLAIARWTARLPFSSVSLPAPSHWALGLSAVGLLVLCLMRSRLRLIGIAVFAAVAVCFATARPPDILVSGDAELVALRLADGELALSSLRRSAFLRDAWSTMQGEAATMAWPQGGETTPDSLLRCDSLGCLYRPPEAPGLTVAIVLRSGALPEDCAAADFVVSVVPVASACPAPLGVIDRFDLWRKGTHAITFVDGGGASITTVAEERGRRPWSPGQSEPDTQ